MSVTHELELQFSEGDRKLFRICKTIFEMLRDRDYSIEDSEINMTMQQFIEKFGKNISRVDLVIHKLKETKLEENDPKAKYSSNEIYVFFPIPEGDKKTVGIKPLRSCIDRMKADNVFKAIFVVRTSLTPNAKQSLKLVNNCFKIDVFQDDELLVNVTKHVRVPKHSLLTEVQKKMVLKKHAVNERQLPRILVTDPVAKYYGARIGQVMKIIRESETAGKYVTYRYVV